jgi:DNA polymerase-3 subunit chi
VLVTEVAFHFGAPDRLAYTCRLLRKATATGARLVVRADAQTRAALDLGLWNVGATDFVTHCDTTATQSVWSRSSVLLLDTGAQLQAEFPNLVNLAEDVPDGFDRFARVIEIVSTDEQDRNLARRRWKHYTELGYTITRHDVKSRAGD